MEATSSCRLCGMVPERADHLLHECPRLASLGSQCFKTWEPSPNPRWEIDWVTKFVEDDLVMPLEESAAMVEEDPDLSGHGTDDPG